MAETPAIIRHPEKLQAIAKVLCHSATGSHRIALINNQLVILDHKIDKEKEEAWQELGGKPSRCWTTLKCFQECRLSRVPKMLYPFVMAAYTKRVERKHRRIAAEAKLMMLSKGKDLFSQMKHYVRSLLKYKCKYECIIKDDNPEITITVDKQQCYAHGLGYRLRDHETSCNAAKRHPMCTLLSLMLPLNWRKSLANCGVPPVIDGYLILNVASRTDDKKKTFRVQILDEVKTVNQGSTACDLIPEIKPFFEWHLTNKWALIQLCNGFWHMGPVVTKPYNRWIPKL